MTLYDRTSQHKQRCLMLSLPICTIFLLFWNADSFIISPGGSRHRGLSSSPLVVTTEKGAFVQNYKKTSSAKFLFFADDSGVEEEKEEIAEPSSNENEGKSGIKIFPNPGDASSINKAAAFMVDSFWLQSPQQLIMGGVGADAVSSAARSGLCEAQAQDLMDKYGERMGKRLLDSCLLMAVDETNGDNILGIVTVQMDLLDMDSGDTLGSEKSEPMLKNAVASLGPKQRRQYKDSPVTELATELLPPEIGAVCVLSNLAISPDARRKGLAMKLCTEAARIVKEEWGFDQIFLRVEAENEAARGLYEKKLGFEQQYAKQGAVAVRVNADEGIFVDIEADMLVLSKDL